MLSLAPGIAARVTFGTGANMTESIPMRAEILREAERLSCGDRDDAYGNPVETMQRTADIFNAITGRDLTADEAAMFHVATKLARLRTSPKHRDSHVDAASYLAIRYECLND